MGINYYNKRRDRILRDIDQYIFDTDSIYEQLDENYDEIISCKQITAHLTYLLPYEHSPQLRWFFQEGEIKSHEFFELIEDIRDQIKNALHSKVSNLTKSIKNFPNLRDMLTFSYMLQQIELEDKNREIIQVKIEITDTSKISLRLFATILTSFIPGIANFSEKLSLKISTPQGQTPLIRRNLTKIPKKEDGHFLTLDDKDEVISYYGEERIKELIFLYFYPMEPEYPPTRITLDKLQSEITVQKSLRIQKYNNEYVRLADYITPDMTHSEFSSIISKNNIEGFYSGVIDLDGNLRYMVFDIDVSSFLRGIISRQTIWEFVLTITNAIIETIQELGIEGYPVVKFSGSRGVHIVYRYDNGVITDEMNRLDLDNYFYNFPGLWDLLKTNNSPLKSKTSFSRLLADAIVVKTIFLKKISIPEEIKKILGITHQKNLFKLSSFSSNEIAILLDTSPCSKGVFRTGFSIHPTTGLGSIPINSAETGEIFHNYTDYDMLRDEATINNIKQHIKFNDKVAQRYGQLRNSAVITREHIEELLEPHKLLPFIAFVLRFTRRFAIERKVGSFYYWYNYYTLKFAFAYIKQIVLKVSQFSRDYIIKKVSDIAEECGLATNKYITQYLHSFLKNQISYPNFTDRLDGLYHFEFYHKIAPSPIPFESKERISELLENKTERKYFLQRFEHVLCIVISIFSMHKDRLNELSERQQNVIKQFYTRMMKFDRLREIMRKKIETKTQSKLAVRELLLIISKYNLLVKFMNSFYKFDRISTPRRDKNE